MQMQRLGATEEDISRYLVDVRDVHPDLLGNADPRHDRIL